jgi:hypothetical protein
VGWHFDARRGRAGALVGVLAACAACTDGGTRLPAGRNVDLRVSPLSLPGIVDACYDVEIRNPGGELVWARGNATTPEATPGADGAICADQFGNGEGGDIAYTGPCDATGTGVNTADLWVDGLWVSNTVRLNEVPGGHIDYANPCAPGGAPCSLTFTCRENEDVPVVFNLTIMRSASQGFFDVAVTFEDVFCSGKLDTCWRDGGGTPTDPIVFLFDPDTGARVRTALFAMACTGGAGNDTESTLYLDDLNVTCTYDLDPAPGAWTGSRSVRLDAHQGGGGHGTCLGTNGDGDCTDPGEVDASGLLRSWAIYRGAELLDCGQGPGSCNKLYWSVGIALDESAPSPVEGADPGNRDCHITTRATAKGGETVFGGGGATGQPFATPVDVLYPVIEVDVRVTAPGAAAWECRSVPLGTYDAGLEEMHAVYSGTGAATFCNALSPTTGAIRAAAAACP